MKYHLTEESYKEYLKDMESQGYKILPTVTISPKICECGRLYKDRKDKDGNMLCSLCHGHLNLESLKTLWETPKK